MPLFTDTMDSFMFSGFPFIFSIVFILIFCLIVFVIINGIRTWFHNNAQPVLSVVAKVVAKRNQVSGSSHHSHGGHHQSSSHTSYYVTFEVESGDRMEFHVRGDEFGLLAEGDIGKLRFQGSRYLGFVRKQK